MVCDDRTVRLAAPCEWEATSALKVGDRVLLSGVIVTGRDLAHRRLVDGVPEDLRRQLEKSFIYHCGPVAVREGTGWRVAAAGPTTSMREEPYQATVIARYGLRGVIGKGGMGAATHDALKKAGGVYLHATGGVGSLLASTCVRVVDVHFLEEFGVPEAMWVLEVRDFPAIVTMDSHGRSLHDDVFRSSAAARKSVLGL